MKESPALSRRLAADRDSPSDLRGEPWMRVLLAADGSEAARIAEAWIRRLRWATPPHVDVLSVARPRRLAAGIALQTYRHAVRTAVDDLRQADLELALGIANSVGERLQSERILTRTWARVGDPASEIGAMVRANAPDLLVIGSSGRRGWFSPPDVASEVIGQVDTAVLVARTLDDDDVPLPRRVVAVTRDSHGGHPREWLARAGWVGGAEVTTCAPEDFDGVTSKMGQDLAVIGRERGSRTPYLSVLDALESASAVLVLPLASWSGQDRVRTG